MDTPILTLKEHWFVLMAALLVMFGGAASSAVEVFDASRSLPDKVVFGLGAVLLAWAGYRIVRYDRTVFFEDRLTVGNLLRTSCLLYTSDAADE